jgi:hypothetical protein
MVGHSGVFLRAARLMAIRIGPEKSSPKKVTAKLFILQAVGKTPFFRCCLGGAQSGAAMKMASTPTENKRFTAQ